MKKLRKILGTVLPLVIVVELVLLFSGVLDLVSAVWVVILVEVSLLIFVIFEFWVIAKAVSAARRSGTELSFALENVMSEFFPNLVARALRHDILLLRAIGMLLTGRRDVKQHEVALPYSGPLVPMLAVITVVDGFVAFGLHMLIPAGWVRTLVLIVGLLGLIWLFGFIATLIVYPHTLSDDRIRLRFGAFQDIIVPREMIIAAERFTGKPASTRAATCLDGALIMVVANQANMRLKTHAMENIVTLNPKLADHKIDQIFFYTDSRNTARKALTSEPL